jgi:hypothetical protein
MARLEISADFSIDTDDYEQTGLRIGVFGGSGSGKGWLLGVIGEELINAGYPVVMLDPEHELWTFQEVGALVVGGSRADAPFVESEDAVAGAIEFCYETATPVVFDLGGRAERDLPRLGDLVASTFWRIAGERMRRVAFIVTEAEIFAPQQVLSGTRSYQTLREIARRGRKRGVTPVLEAQRPADIAKSVIAQCNVRFLGRFDDTLDYDAVKRHLAGLSFDVMRALERHEFYVRQADGMVIARDRRVTHGGGTPPEGEQEISIGRRAGRAALAKVIAGLESASAAPGPAEQETTATPTAGRAKAPPSDRGDRAELERAKRDLEQERHHVSEVELRLEAARGETDQLRESEASAREAADTFREMATQLADLRGTLRAVIGVDGAGPVQAAAGDAYAGDEHVIELIRQHAPAAGGVQLMPVDVLRKRFLEETAQRLVELMRALEEDERTALLFLLAHPGPNTLNAIAKALSGNDGGGARDKWGKATNALKAKGLVQVAANRTTRRASVDEWAAAQLAPHSATDEECAAVRDRALSVLMAEVR